MSLGQHAGWRAATVGRWALLRLGLLCAAALPVAAADQPAVQASEPRAYGWQLGDVIERELLVQLPPGWTLRSDSLPQPRNTGQALELRSVQHGNGPDGALQLRLRYQVMRSPEAVRAYEIAPVLLQAQGPQRMATLRVEAWPVLVAPLAPPEVLNRRGLGDLQPDRGVPAPQDPGRPWRLAAEALLAALALLAFSHARWGRWWWPGPPPPMAQAWRQLRRLRPGADVPALQAATRTLHRALDRRAGHTLTRVGLPAFCAADAAFAGEQAALQQFFGLSEALFFADQAPPADAAAQLRAWCQRWRRQERLR